MFITNNKLSSVERIAGKDRYGKPLLGVVEVDLPCHFVHNSLITRNVDGTFSEINADIRIETEIFQHDKLTLENGDRYVVYSVQELLDGMGNPDHWLCRLVKEEERIT